PRRSSAGTDGVPSGRDRIRALRPFHPPPCSLSESRDRVEPCPRGTNVNRSHDIGLVALLIAAALIANCPPAVGAGADATHPPEDVWPHAKLADTLAAKGDLDGAIGEYRKALGIDPDNVPVHGNLANALARKGDFDGAIQEYRRMLGLGVTGDAAAL